MSSIILVRYLLVFFLGEWLKSRVFDSVCDCCADLCFRVGRVWLFISMIVVLKHEFCVVTFLCSVYTFMFFVLFVGLAKS